MPQTGFHCIVDLEDVSFETCIGCASTQARCQFTASMIRGMAQQTRQRTPESTISVTELTGCARQAYLTRTHDYHARPDHQYWSYRGALSHLLVERGAGEEVIAERRFERTITLPDERQITLTGQPDEIDPARNLLIDYKTTDRAPRTVSEGHIAQLNLYRWLVGPELEINQLGIVYITMRGVSKKSVPLWPDAVTERFIRTHAGALDLALHGGDWPEMTTETWMCRYCPVAEICERGPFAALRPDPEITDQTPPHAASPDSLVELEPTRE